MGLVPNLQTPQRTDSVSAKLPCGQAVPGPGEVPREMLRLIYRRFPKKKKSVSGALSSSCCLSDPARGRNKLTLGAVTSWGPQSSCCSCCQANVAGKPECARESPGQPKQPRSAAPSALSLSALPACISFPYLTLWKKKEFFGRLRGFLAKYGSICSGNIWEKNT